MDLQAYSWACGSSIRCLAGDEEDAVRQADANSGPGPLGEVVLARGLVSVWAAAVQVAADYGDVEDVEAELGPYAAAIVSASKFELKEDDEENGSEKEDPEESKRPPEEAPRAEVSLVNSELQLAMPEKARDGPAAGLDGFLGLLSAWSDDAPATRLLEEARQIKKPGALAGKAPAEPRRPLKKESLEKLRSERFPCSRAPSPPSETRHWRQKDFELYFGSDGVLQPRAEPEPNSEELLAQEMRQTSQASPLLAEMRMQLAQDKVVQPPSEYAAFCQHLLDHCGDMRTVPAGEVLPIPRSRRAPDVLKSPICIEKQRGWKMRSWGMAYWSYECGQAACDCFRRYPPSTAESDASHARCLRARVDEFAKYVNMVRDMDPQCKEENYLAYPRYLACWSPFGIPKLKPLWEQDLKSGRKLWGPPGLKDLSAKWFDMCCLAVGLLFEPELAQQDTLQFGPPGMLVRPYIEDCSAHVWHAQIQGRRMFALFAPQESATLEKQTVPVSQTLGVDVHARSRTSSIDIFASSQRLKDSQCYMALLEPGETLIIPAGWWQCSVALEPFTTISRRFWNRSNRLGVCDVIAKRSDASDLGPRQKSHLISQLPVLREQMQQEDMSSGED